MGLSVCVSVYVTLLSFFKEYLKNQILNIQLLRKLPFVP